MRKIRTSNNGGILQYSKINSSWFTKLKQRLIEIVIIIFGDGSSTTCGMFLSCHSNVSM